MSRTRASLGFVLSGAFLVACAAQGEPVAIDEPTGAVSLADIGLPPDWPPLEVSFRGSKLSVGVNHTCALLIDGKLACWGSNAFGQLGIGTTSGSYSRPQRAVSELTGITAVGAGEEHTCAVRTGSGLVSCWGKNAYGRSNPLLTNGQPPTVGCPINGTCATPSTVSGVSGALGIAAGYDHTCVRRESNVMCWGRTSHNLLYRDDAQGWPITIGGGAISVEAGEYFTCVHNSTHTGYCWGRRPMSDRTSWESTETLWTLPSEQALAVGRRHLCTINLYSEMVLCSGESTYGQAGSATTPAQPLFSSTNPTGVPDARTSFAVAAGARHTCALFRSGALKCWGANDYGQLGAGVVNDILPPVTVGGGIAFTAIAAGGDNTCALTDVGRVYCWGRNDLGQVGSGSSAVAIATPQLVKW